MNERVSEADDADLDGLGERICELAGHLAAATATWLELVARFDRERGWVGWGVRSCAHWLSWKCGLGLNAAREHVRVASALEALPGLAAEFRAGRLSYSKVRAVTRVATTENEAGLVATALCSTGAQLEHLVAGLRRAGSADDVNARHEARSLTWSWHEDGSLVLRGRLSPEDGALLLAALDTARAELPLVPEFPLTAKQAAADALLVLAETALRSGVAPVSGGRRYQVQLHTDLDALLDDAASESAMRIEDGPELHRTTAERILCDSAALIVAHHRPHHRSGGHRCGSTSMDVGRRTRTIPPALRRALFLRDHGCRFPGCTQRRFVDGHHIRHWSRGGRTDLSNLILLCRHHHRLLHEGGYSLTSARHGMTFRRPNGEVLAAVPVAPGGRTEALPEHHGAAITAATAVPDWNGDRLDLDYAVAVLSQVSIPTLGNVSAETFPAVPGDPRLN